MLRLFVALPLPPEVRTRLTLLGGGVPGARWMPPESLHLTLRFIGEVDGGTAQDIAEALDGIDAPPFALTLAGIDTFGQGEAARVLWVGVEREPALLELRERVESALRFAGIAPDAQKYIPHVTLARLKKPSVGALMRQIAANSPLRLGPVAFDRFILYSSWSQADGPFYREEAVYPLEEETNG
jgi:2'-5' RNA ligase